MSRYIDADALKRKWLFRGKDGKAYRDVIDEMPTADVVEVVRCKDCANWQIDWIPTIGGDKGCHYCETFDSSTEPLNYCGYAERRNNKNAEPIPHWRGQMDGCLPFQEEEHNEV